MTATLNPKYLFQLVATDLLVAIVQRQIDPVELAHRELRNRGLDDNVRWIGLRMVKPKNIVWLNFVMLDFSRIMDRSDQKIFVWLNSVEAMQEIRIY